MSLLQVSLGEDEQESLDLLALAPHPDDAELGVGGILALAAIRGLRAGVLDLSAGELSTNGTPGERSAEAVEASQVLGLQWRGCLGLPDGSVGSGEDQVSDLARVLRLVRPSVLLAPHPGDRHPDHRRAGDLAERAVFHASLSRADVPGDRHTVRETAFYLINGFHSPDLVVDVSEVHHIKRKAIRAFRSQFDPRGRKPTVLNERSFLRMIFSRDAMLGAARGVIFAEGLVLKEPLWGKDLDPLFFRHQTRSD